MWLFVLFVAVPVIEIALFIQVGGLIGLFPTLAIVIFTAVLGSYLMRSQGLATLRTIQTRFSSLQDPTEPMAHGAMILFAGALLLTPGFFTDTLGLLLMMPAFRTLAFQWVKSRIKVNSFTMGGFQQTQTRDFRRDTDVWDGEYTDVTPNNDTPWSTKPIAKD